MNDKYWMQHALTLANIAKSNGEIPVGAVLILKEKIIGQGWNASINHNDPTAHAEIMALRQGGKRIKNYRLLNTTLYVTLEPCIMCFGAIINSRIKNLVCGASDKNKNINMIKKLLKDNKFNHNLKIKENILIHECSKLMNQFFKNKRKIKKLN